MIRLGPGTAECRVLTFREGLLAWFGHDLELAVTRFDIRVDEQARRADASFDAASLRVVRASQDGVDVAGGLSDANRRTIEDTVRRDVFDVMHHPEIRYRSTRVVDVDGGFDVSGKLLLHGKERDVMVPLRRADDRYVAEVRLDQRDFGMRPYRAMLGMLAVKPDVVVRLSLPVAVAR